MTTAKIKKFLLAIATIVGGAVLVTAGLRASATSKASGTSFTTAYADEIKKTVQTKTA